MAAAHNREWAGLSGSAAVAYGSQTPFEHIRREQQIQQQQRMMRRRDVIKWVWVPHAAADAV